MTDIIKKEDNEIVTKEKILEYLKLFLPVQLNEKHKNQFIAYCMTYKLDPIKREVHPVVYGNQLTIITGYEVYLKRAERTGKLDGHSIEYIGEFGKPNYACKIKIYRTDRKYPIEHIVYFDEFKGTKKDGGLNAFWRKQPRFQLEKVAISQGYRIAFPDELGGTPYTNDEYNENIIDDISDNVNETEKLLDNIDKNNIDKKDDIEKAIHQAKVLKESVQDIKHEMTKDQINHYVKLFDKLENKGIPLSDDQIKIEYEGIEAIRESIKNIDKNTELGIIDDNDKKEPELFDENKEDSLPKGVV